MGLKSVDLLFIFKNDNNPVNEKTYQTWILSHETEIITFLIIPQNKFARS